MNTIHNKPEQMVENMIDGYVKANKELLNRVSGTKAIYLKNQSPYVKILSGGGAGCEPMYLGYCGLNMADAIVCGNVFSAPPATALLRTIHHLDNMMGILMVTGNYVGDVLNYQLAIELCEYEGIKAKAVFVGDDILHAPKPKSNERRGITGIMCVIKAAAGAAVEGLELDEVERIALKASHNLGTVSATFWPGYRPETGVLMYEMKNDEIEIGMGFNGEPGVLRMKMPDSNTLAKTLLNYLIEDMMLEPEDDILLIVNGKGGTSNIELFVFADSLHCYLDLKGINTYKTEVGNFFTAPGMGGVSVTIMKLDDELKHYYNKDSYTPMYMFKAHR